MITSDLCDLLLLDHRLEEVHQDVVQGREDDLDRPEHPRAGELAVEGREAEVAAGLDEVLGAERHALEHAGAVGHPVPLLLFPLRVPKRGGRILLTEKLLARIAR